MFVEFIDNFLDGLEAETIQFCQVWRQKAQNSILENPCQEQKIHCAQFFVGLFFSSCRTDLIRSELFSPDPGAPPKYHSMFVGPIEKILDGLEAETTRFCQVWRQKAQSRILENTCLKAKNPLGSVFRGAFFSRCRTELIQRVMCFPDPGAPPKYPRYVFRAYEKKIRWNCSRNDRSYVKSGVRRLRVGSFKFRVKKQKIH